MFSKLTRALAWVSLWVSAWLVLGIVVGQFSRMWVAVMSVGDVEVNSSTPGGAAFIGLMAAWIAALALGIVLRDRQHAGRAKSLCDPHAAQHDRGR
jgi:Na+/H+-dicarboxylate symporter